MKKTIAVDCSKLNNSYKTGTHRFLIGFLNELVKNKNFDYFFYINNSGENLKDFEFTKKGKIIAVPYSFGYTQLGLLKELNKYDYFIFPWQTIPFLGFFSKSKKISIIHDSGFSLKSKITTFLTQIVSDQVFSVSSYTAKNLFRKSIVIGEGVDTSLFYPLDVADLKKYSKELNIPNFFILSLGRIEIRKNIYNNLLAFAKIKNYYPNLKYVFIGGFVGDEEKIYSFMGELGLTREEVLFKKNISDFELNVYLNLMEFLVFTSLEEGFGLPVLEAYAVQKPVLLSKIEQLAEFKLSAKQYVDPYNVPAISEKMIKFLKKEHGIESKKEYKEILNQFTWKRCVENFINNLQ